MNKYSFEVSIEAQTQGEAEVKLSAASTLMQKLKAREIAKQLGKGAAGGQRLS